MDRNFSRALSSVLKHEGGFVNHPRDPGGATNKGVTIATFRRYVKKNGTVADLKAISDAQLAQVYRKHYWDAVKGDDLPDGVDYAVFDFAVNSGPSRAARYLQGGMGVVIDGQIGPATIRAAQKYNSSEIVNRLCDDRMEFLKGLKTWRTFGKGWTRRVDGVRKEALEMARLKSVPRSDIPSKPSAPPTEAPVGFWTSLFAVILSALKGKRT
jgi:lysozyme family protein